MTSNEPEISQDIYEAVARDSLETVLKQIIEKGVEITGSDYAGLWLYNANNKEVYLKIDTEQNEPYENRHNCLNINSSQQSIVREVFKTKRTHLSPDVAKDKYYLNARQNTRSQLTVPMIFQDQFIGLINFESKNLKAFNEGKNKLIESLASQAAIAIQIASLTEQKIKENSHQKVFITLLEQILTAGIEPNENAIFNYIHQNASALMDTQNMYITTYDDETNTIKFVIAYLDGNKINVKPGEEEEGYKPRKDGRGKTEEIIQTRKPLLHTTKAESEQWYKQHEEYVGRIPFSWVGVPMKLGEKVIGVIATYNMTKENVYNQEDLDILKKLADWAAIALENARLSAKEKQKTIELQKANEKLKQANEKIAENERFLTRSFIVQDFVHRLNNLAGTIPTWATLIQGELAEISEIPESKIETVKSYLTNIYEEANFLLRETEKLKSNEFVSININEILKSIIDNFKIKYYNEVESESLNLEIKIDEELYKVKDIASSLSNALFNIIANGIEAVIENKQPGKLIVCTQNHIDNGKHWVKINIQDTGIGISPENKSKIFTLFFSTKEANNNSGQYDRGYGVWRTKNVIEKLGGKISFSSEFGKGTAFTILLPPDLS